MENERQLRRPGKQERMWHAPPIQRKVWATPENRFTGRVTGKELAKWAEGVNFVLRSGRRGGDQAASALFDPCCSGDRARLAWKRGSGGRQVPQSSTTVRKQSNWDDGTCWAKWDFGRGKAKELELAQIEICRQRASWG